MQKQLAFSKVQQRLNLLMYNHFKFYRVYCSSLFRLVFILIFVFSACSAHWSTVLVLNALYKYIFDLTTAPQSTSSKVQHKMNICTFMMGEFV